MVDMNDDCTFTYEPSCSSGFAGFTVTGAGLPPETIVSMSLGEHTFVLQADDKGNGQQIMHIENTPKLVGALVEQGLRNR
jgi:hypothetical protein